MNRATETEKFMKDALGIELAPCQKDFLQRFYANYKDGKRLELDSRGRFHWVDATEPA
jgi:hypothetical protein